MVRRCSSLMSVISDLKKEIKSKNVEIDNMNKSIIMFNHGADNLEKILAMGKFSRKKHGLGFVAENSNNEFSLSRPIKSAQNEVGSSRIVLVSKKEK